MLDDLPGRLRRWADREVLPGGRVAGLAPMPGNAGLSFGFDVVDGDGAVVRSLVVRFAPPGVRRSGNTDVLRQVPLLQALDRAGIPVAPLVWWTGDEAWFGTDAIVQERLAARPLRLWDAGEAAPDPAPYLRAAVGVLARIHALDWAADLAGWERPRPVAEEIAFWQRLLDKHPEPGWTAAGQQLAADLLRTDPGRHRTGLFHGDFHTNNVLFDDDASVAAVVDWEIAGIGATGLDLGWLALMTDPSCWHPDQQAAMRVVADPARLRADYEAAAGVAVPDLAWYQALACYRFGAIAGFNVRLHRTGRRPDPLYEDMASSVPVFFARGTELVRGG
ncbi:phosphotransferase family protein [Petropleomorpha daqingensis]|uniref:Aminoglycoside phosphotransferase (APT) family kinase protein n=1 Tax=Petropleomorpha daqingensis TaxID=2026353 RepID=A0A853CM95_9ACTN|nr:aminoglycoside phosphotransferase (APT) family kinase protein [Petropleomorpha daqingensis]